MWNWIWAFKRLPCLVHPLKHMFLVFKQYYTYVHTLFHPHIFLYMFSNTCFQFLSACTKHPEWKLPFYFFGIWESLTIWTCVKNPPLCRFFRYGIQLKSIKNNGDFLFFKVFFPSFRWHFVIISDNDKYT